jgi:hypothetical protein
MGRQEKRERYHDMKKQLFRMGSVYSTPGALAVCASFPMTPDVLLIRHVTGDWSDMSKADQEANRQAIEDGSRIFSAYQYGEHRFYVITEVGRGSTTILLSGEY